MHYESLFVIPGVYGAPAQTEMMRWTIAQLNGGQAVYRYATKAVNIMDQIQLLDPVELVFSSVSDFNAVKGGFMENASGAVYYIPPDAVFQRKSYAPAGITIEYYITCSNAQIVEKVELVMGVGYDQLHPIMASKITSYSNDSDDYLNMGSVCASVLEAEFMCMGHNMSIPPGEEIMAYKIRVDDDGTRTQTQIGVYTCEEPEQINPNRYRIVGYDNVRKLDKDISAWLNALPAGWSYTMPDFKRLVAQQCGLEIASEPTTSRMVHCFTVPDGTTARQVMRWIGECECQFCIATADGKLQFAWYKPLLNATTNQVHKFFPDKYAWGGSIYFKGTMRYDAYDVAVITDFVVVTDEKAMEIDIAARGDDGQNPYYIVGNPIILNHTYYKHQQMGPGGSSPSYFESWRQSLATRYAQLPKIKPFSLAVAEDHALRTGTAVQVETRDGMVFDSCITELECKSGRMRVSCKCRRNRSGSKSPGDMSNADILAYTDRTLQRASEVSPGLEMDGLTVYATPEFIRIPAWIDLGISDAVSLPTAANQHGHYVGCGYRVVGKMVYVAANVAFDYSGAAIVINSVLIPEEYRPAHNVYCDAWCNGRNLARAFVSTAGNVAVEYVQSLTTGSSTTNFAANWIDIWIQYFLD